MVDCKFVTYTFPIADTNRNDANPPEGATAVPARVPGRLTADIL